MFYIYGLREKGSDEYRYVGRTVNPEKRLREHTQIAKPVGRGPDLHRWLESVGFAPVMDILDRGEALDRQTEQHWIEKLAAAGHRLTNMWAASITYSNFGYMVDDAKRDVIADYLDKFESDADKPWFKEDGPVYEV
jgi:hypothetical protein